MATKKSGSSEGKSDRFIVWGIFSLCAIAMGFGTILLNFLRLHEFAELYNFLAVCAVLLGILAISWMYLISSNAQVKAEETLRTTLAQLQAMTDNVPCVLFQWYQKSDGTHGFRYCSPRSKELFGFDSDEVVRDWRKINIHPGDMARWAQSLEKCGKNLENWLFDGRMTLPDGGTKWWKGVATPVREDDGEVVINGIMLDITDAKEAEREIKESRRNAERLGSELLLVNQNLNETNATLQKINRQKNEILGIAAHDLKNPLGGIVGFSGAIRVSLDSENLESMRGDMIEMTESIEQSARHMLHIINGLLNASALEDGTVKLEITDCDMSLLSGSVIALNEPSARKKRIAIKLETENGCVVYGDLQRLQEVVDNLISNAIKYSPPGASVRIGVYHSSPSMVRLSVRDEGPGLTEDDKKKLFGKFQKLSARPTGGESSTGLGLAIAKSIVELHSGKIWVESEEGHGCDFLIDLPVHAPAADQQQPKA
jgi:PAS domain S-box-containing protein